MDLSLALSMEIYGQLWTYQKNKNWIMSSEMILYLNYWLARSGRASVAYKHDEWRGYEYWND